MKKIFKVYAWLFGRPIFSKFNNFIYELALRGLGVYNYANRVISGEKWLLDHVVKKLGSDLIVFDVGANVGGYTKELIDSGVDTRVIFAFEPHPITFSALKENTSKYACVVPISSALSDQEGEVALYDRADENGTSHASLDKRIFLIVHKVKSKFNIVKVDTIDAFSQRNMIDTIDFLKIDVEGFELKVLHGARKMLKDKKIRCIQFEFTQLNSVIGVFFKEFYEILSADYDIFRLLPHGLKAIDRYCPTTCEIFGYQNYVAIMKNNELLDEYKY